VPLGSTYHYFPSGKQQLVAEAVETIGHRIDRLIGRAADTPDAALDDFADGWRAVLQSTDFRSGCPVLAVALEEDPVLRKAANEIFDRWRDSLTHNLIASGVDPARAPRLARTVVAAIEGAVALCRAEHSFEPLEDVLSELRLMLVRAGNSSNAKQTTA